MEIEKSETYKQLLGLQTSLKGTIGDNKNVIIKQVKLALISGGEAEGLFTKMFLLPIIQKIFPNSIVEGVNSAGKTQFKHTFFGAKPAPDFIIEEPAKIVGEVKYDFFATRSVATAIGQILLYLEASKAESQQYDYGCIIFFDTSLKFKEQKKEESHFIEHLWTNENIFLIII